ncbi:hypothetical protein H8E77_03765 [bacterium]|nr:hypothetical protein [bacterium]
MRTTTHDFVLAQETTDAFPILPILGTGRDRCGLRYVVDLPIHNERPGHRSCWIGKSSGRNQSEQI